MSTLSAVAAVAARQGRQARVSPDRLVVAVFAIALVTLIMAASYVFSFTAIAEAAVWSGAPVWARPLAPVFIDGAILTYTLTYAVFRYRGESSKRTLAFLYVFTVISTLVNVAHSAAFNHWDLSHRETWFGMLIAASAPLAALLASEEVIRLALAHPGAAPEVTAPRAHATDLAEVLPDGPHAIEATVAATQRSEPTADDNPPATPQARTEAHSAPQTYAPEPETVVHVDPPFDPDHDLAPEDGDALRIPADAIGEVVFDIDQRLYAVTPEHAYA